MPSRQVYNAILRQYPADVFGRFRAGGNLYATTIHILVSAVIKVARSTKLPTGLELFRGLGGLMALPDSFFSVDANGCRGYAEWGFLSTTSNRAVAVEVPPCPRTPVTNHFSAKCDKLRPVQRPARKSAAQPATAITRCRSS